MEDLRAKVYECTLVVEAHMICDLLARAGISARVDGEFLAGAGGDLPLGNNVKVRVDPGRAAEARAIIDEWERTQPPEPMPPTEASRFRSPLWFLAGVIAGGLLVFVALRSPATQTGMDYDGDGDEEIRYHYAGQTLSLSETDRNRDGKVDMRLRFDSRGLEQEFTSDDDFDGRFEWRGTYRNGELHVSTRDTDGDGRADETWRFVHGVTTTGEYHREGGPIVKRENYLAGLLVSADFDADADGAFERHVEYDRFGEPK